MAIKSKYIENHLVVESLDSDIKSNSIDIFNQEILAFHVIWTGTLTGVVDLEVSNDEDNWVPVGMDGDNPSGSDSSTMYELSSGSRYIRFSFVHTSGSGSLTVHYCGKSTG